MFAGDDAAARRNVFDPPEFEFRAANFVEKPDRVTSPNARKGLNGVPPEQKTRQAADQKTDQVEVKKQVKKSGSQKNHVIGAPGSKHPKFASHSKTSSVDFAR